MGTYEVVTVLDASLCLQPSNGPWEFLLIVDLPELARQYTPKSDASLHNNKFLTFSPCSRGHI